MWQFIYHHSDVTWISWRLKSPVFRRTTKKTSKFLITGLCEGVQLVTGGFPSQRDSNADMFLFNDVITYWMLPHNLVIICWIRTLDIGTMTSTITNNSTVCSKACSCHHKRKRPSPTFLSLCDRNPSVTGVPYTNGQWCGKGFHSMTYS